MSAFGGGKSRFESDIGTRYAGRSQNKYQRLDAGISVGANPTPGSLYARVSEWFKEKVCKSFIRKFKSCPVLQSMTYNRGVKIKRKSVFTCVFLSKSPSLRGLFGSLRSINCIMRLYEIPG